MTKVVYNNDYGGFGLSDKTLELYKARTGIIGSIYDFEIPRHDPVLVEIVEELGPKEAGDRFSSLCICEIDSNKYIIDEYDGLETVVTPDNIGWISVED